VSDWLTRDYGLGCDQVDKVELVLANGQPRTVSASAPSQEDKDLFWAVCGGGGNLGFVTKWWLRTQPADDVVAFRARWKPKLLGKERDIFTSLVRALEKSSNRMGAQVSIFATTRSSGEPNQVTLTGQLRGNTHRPRPSIRGFVQSGFCVIPRSCSAPSTAPMTRDRAEPSIISDFIAVMIPI
jgi:FAD/FMN-containing dehydrogenase